MNYDKKSCDNCVCASKTRIGRYLFENEYVCRARESDYYGLKVEYGQTACDEYDEDDYPY